MKFKHFLLILVVSTFAIFTSCVKSDDYIDWKVMNDEWLAANNESKVSYPFNWTIDVLKAPVIQSEFQTTESGIKYKMLRQGNPTEKKPNLTSHVYVTYEGKLIDGTSFDSGVESYLGQTFALSQGFQEIILKMHIGDIYELYVPHTLGYGSKGTFKVPPYSVLTFRVELTDAIN